MTLNNDKPLTVGRYLISPLTRLTDVGDYCAGVSIRSGRGSETCDRIYRFTDRFVTREAAASYGMAQGLQWVVRTPHAAASFLTTATDLA